MNAYVCVWFSIPCQQFLLRLEVFSVQVGCVYDKLGGSSSERHIVVSLSKTESVHIQKNIPFPKKRFCRYNSSFLMWAWKTRKWCLPALYSFTNNVCSLRLLEKTWQQLFLWVINLCRSSCGVICLVIARVIFLLQSDCSEITKVHNFSLVSLLYN